VRGSRLALFLILSLVPLRWAGKYSGTSSVYQSLLADGKEKRVCGACNRRMSDKELLAFEKNVGHPTFNLCATAIIMPF